MVNIILVLMLIISFAINWALIDQIDGLEKDIKWWEHTAHKNGWDR